MQISRSLPLVLLFAVALAAQAKASPVGPPTTSPLGLAERYELESQALGERRSIDIYLPASYELSADERSYPVIFVLDGEFMFHTVTGVVSHLASVGLMPESIVIGIPNSTGRRLSLAPPLLRPDGTASRASSQADAYLEFFATELIPFIERRWRAAPFRTLLGLSPTAAFTLHVFAKAPGLFQAHVALVIGHTLGYRYTETESVVDALEKSLIDSPGREALLYLGSASSNFDQDDEISQAFEHLEKRLAPFASRLKLQTERLSGSAYAIALPGVISALEMIFPKESWDISYLDFMVEEGSTPQKLDAHFAELSAHYGFRIWPRGNRFYNVHCLRGLGSRLSAQNRFEEAAEIFHRWAEESPKLPAPYLYWAEALESSSKPQQAIKIARRGIDIAEQSEGPNREFFKLQLQQLTQRLSQPAASTSGSAPINP